MVRRKSTVQIKQRGLERVRNTQKNIRTRKTSHDQSLKHLTGSKPRTDYKRVLINSKI